LQHGTSTAFPSSTKARPAATRKNNFAFHALTRKKAGAIVERRQRLFDR